jgi:hypothetical protein
MEAYKFRVQLDEDDDHVWVLFDEGNPTKIDFHIMSGLRWKIFGF